MRIQTEFAVPIRTLLAICLFATIALGGCRRRSVPAPPATRSAVADSPSGPWFEDVTEKSGVHFVHEAGPVGNYHLPEIMGSGAALFDFDNDGRLDVYLVQNGGPQGPRNQLFHQERNGTFRDVSAGSGLDVAGFGMGVAIGDVNNDGFPDVLLCEYGGIRLFLNKGDGSFIEVTREAGLAEHETDGPIRRWASAATFFDLDRDGRLDLAVVEYVAYDPSRSCFDGKGVRDYCGPKDFPGSITRVYRNLGWDSATDISKDHMGRMPMPLTMPLNPHFQEITAKAGLGESPGPGLGIITADFDGDGWPDLFVANDGQPNRLWINQHDDTFKDQAVQRGVAYTANGQTAANMGIALGDVNGDGLFDLYITHLADESNTLWMQNPRGMFTDRTALAGLIGHGQGTGFGTVLADFDLDGALDLAVVNGRVVRGANPPGDSEAPHLPVYWRKYAERNQLFQGDGRGCFRDIASENASFCGTPNVARALAYGDIFNDGMVSLLVTTVAGPARIYRNVAPRRGHWLVIRAIDPALGGRDAYGAIVTVRTANRRFVGLVNPGSSYLCSNDPRVHVGLGATEHVEAIEVQWPDGMKETFAGGKVDALRVVRRGEGQTAK